jgi:hypothetical protein
LFLLRATVQDLKENPFVAAALWRAAKKSAYYHLFFLVVAVMVILPWVVFNAVFFWGFEHLAALQLAALYLGVVACIVGGTRSYIWRVIFRVRPVLEYAKRWFEILEDCLGRDVYPLLSNHSISFDALVRERLIELATIVIKGEEVVKQNPLGNRGDWAKLGYDFEEREQNSRRFQRLHEMFFLSEIVPHGQEYYFKEAERLLAKGEIEKPQPAQSSGDQF